jgi:excisionase family DNA binding protein
VRLQGCALASVRGDRVNDKLLTVDQVAEALNTTPRFVRRLIAERRICFHRLGRHVRILESDVEAFVAAGRVSVPGGTRHARTGGP